MIIHQDQIMNAKEFFEEYEPDPEKRKIIFDGLTKWFLNCWMGAMQDDKRILLVQLQQLKMAIDEEEGKHIFLLPWAKFICTTMWPTFQEETSKLMEAHLQGCEQCQEKKRKYEEREAEKAKEKERNS